MGVLTRTRIPYSVVALLAGAVAPTSGVANTYVANITITDISIYPRSSAPGAYVVITPSLPSGTEGCTQSPMNEVWIDFSSTIEPTGKSLYATVLSAFLAGRKVTFGVSGCALSGQVPVVYRVDVQ